MAPQTFLDLFSGAGGLALGLRAAGLHPLLGVDVWPDAVATHRRNFVDHDVLCGDIRDLDAQSLARHLATRPDWIVGGPPCQGFSTVGRRRKRDPRNQLVEELHRLVRAFEPHGFVIENVLGLKDMRYQGAVIDLFADLGYTVSFQVLRAADYGIPQLRRRVLFVGHRERGFFQRPMPTHTERDFVTVSEAIDDLPPLGPGESAARYHGPARTDYQRRMRAGSDGLQGHVVSKHPPHLVKAISFIPDGGNRRSIPARYQPRSGFHNSYSRLSSARPAVAVTSNMGKPSATRCIHPFQDRGLTAREGARLQSFPDRFWFEGGVTSQRLQIANAVAPVLSEAIGRALLAAGNWSQDPAGAPVCDLTLAQRAA